MVSSLALKYAKPLFEVAAEQGRTSEIGEELIAFNQLLEDYDELRRTLKNPTLPFAAKRGIVQKLATAVPLGTILVNFVLLVVKNARLARFGEMVQAYRKVLDDERGLVRGTMTAAHPLSVSDRQRLQQALRELTGQQVELEYRQDGSLIGGVEVRIGSVIYDGSIRTQLETLHRKLAEQ